MSQRKVYHGLAAVRQVEQQIGRRLSYGERRVVEEEGYDAEPYEDTKGIITQGVGQTGQWIEKGFPAAFKHHEHRARRRVPTYDRLPEYLRGEFIQSEYRGDLGGSPTAVRLFNEGRYDEAATEFLNHAEYENPDTPVGIRNRIAATARAIRRFGREQALQP